MFFFSRGYSGVRSSPADTITDWNATADQIDVAVAGTQVNYREASTVATSLTAAAAEAESRFSDSSVSHVFLYNTRTDTGYLLCDLDNDNAFETGIILARSGRASDLSYADIM